MISIKKAGLLSLFMSFSVFLLAQDLSFNLTVTSAKQTEPMLINVYVSGSKIAMQPQNMGVPGTLTILVDNSKGTQHMLMNSNGQKIAMPISMDNVEKAKAAAKEPKVTVTKETKIVDGHKCYKVITETEDQKTDLWMTEDVGMQYAEFYKLMSAAKGPQGASMIEIPELKNLKGFPIEIVTTDKKKSETVTIKIKNISKAKVDQKLFSMEGYQMMDSGGKTH